VSHLSVPPAKFAFSLQPYPEDGSVLIKKRARKQHWRRRLLRRRLNTALSTITIGRLGALMVNGVETQKALLVVTAIPTGVRPDGIEKTVEIRYNIIIERKVVLNTLPEAAVRMIGFGVVSLFITTLCLVPRMSRLISRADEIITRQKGKDGKREK